MPTPRTKTGTLTAAATVLYRVPQGSYAIVSNLTLCNKSGTARNIDVLIRGPGESSSVTVASASLAVAHAAACDWTLAEERWVLEPGTTIEAFAAAASAIDYFISAMEYPL